MPMAFSSVSLGELVRLVLPVPVRLEPAYRDRDVRWVVMAGAGVAPQSGDLVLAGAALTRQDMTQWAERDVSAVVTTVPSPSLVGVKLPVLVLPMDTDLRNLQRAALGLMMNRQAYLMERGAQIYKDLAARSLDEETLNGLAQTMRQQTGKNILVQDKRLKPLASAPLEAMSAEDWERLTNYLSSWSHMPESLRDRRQAAAVGSWQEQPMPDGLVRLVCPIVAKGMARGYLSIISKAGELDALDQLVVEHGAAACALEMAKVKAVNEAEKRAQGDFIDSVLTASVPMDELRRWAQRLGYDVEPPHVALMWRWAEQPNAPSLRRLETIVNQTVTKEGVLALVRLRGNEIVVFCAVSDVGRPNIALRLAAGIHRAAYDEYPNTPVYGGVSRAAADLSEWRDAHREAQQAFSMAVRLSEKQPLFFGDLSVYRLLFLLEGHEELENFCREVLGPLMDYAGGGDLLETLEAFCDRLGNLSQTAEKLFIHRNSLLYRMERISQLAGIDMNNPDTRLAVHLALKVRKMLREEKKRVP